MKIRILVLLGMICVIMSSCSEMKGGNENSIEETNITTEKFEDKKNTSTSIEGQDVLSEENIDASIGVADTESTDEENTSISVEQQGNQNEFSGEEKVDSLDDEEKIKETEKVSESIELKIEGCYDDPNNPVANQDYDVGEPQYE